MSITNNKYLGFFFPVEVFHPFGKFRVKWDVTVCAVMVYVLVDIPIQLCFEIDVRPETVWGSVDLAVNVFFMVDILVNFNTAFFKESQVISSRVEIAKEYLKRDFWLDIITSIPFQNILDTNSNASKVEAFTRALKIFRVLRLVKLFRVMKLMNTVAKWQENDETNTALVGLSKFALLMFMIGHTVACLFVGVDMHYRSADQSYENYKGYDEQSWMVRFSDTWAQPQLIQYLRALYFAFTTLTTVGYGDITPLLPLEICLTIIMQLLGTSMFGFIIGNISSLITQEDKYDVMIQDKMDTVRQIIKSRQLPDGLSARIKNHYTYAWKHSRIVDEEEVFEELPFAIKTECALFIHRDIIQKVPMLNTLSAEVLPSLVARLKPQLASSGDIIIKEGLFGTEMTFINRGSIILSTGFFDRIHVEMQLDVVQEGDYIADYAVVLDQARHPITGTASSYCDLFVLTHQDYLQFGDEFPKTLIKIIDICKERYVSLTNMINEKRQLQTKKQRAGSLPCNQYATPSKEPEMWGMHQDEIAVKSPTHSKGRAGLRAEKNKEEEGVNGRLSALKQGLVSTTGYITRLLERGPAGEKNMLFLEETKDSCTVNDSELSSYNTSPDVSALKPTMLLRIYQWKDRAVLQVTCNRLDVVKKRHIEKFKLDKRSQQSARLSSMDAAAPQLCSQCAENFPQGLQVTTDDLERLEQRLQSSMREEICELRLLITNLLSGNPDPPSVQLKREFSRFGRLVSQKSGSVSKLDGPLARANSQFSKTPDSQSHTRANSKSSKAPDSQLHTNKLENIVAGLTSSRKFSDNFEESTSTDQSIITKDTDKDCLFFKLF